MKQIMKRFLLDEQAQDLVEYALIVAAVGLALIATVGQLSTAISSVYQSIIAGLATIGAGGQ
jgi:pilus assembly protein Flp/PilA